MSLSQDAKVHQVDTKKHRGANVCLPHTFTVKTHTLSIFSVVIHYRAMGTRLQQGQLGFGTVH